MHGAKIKMKTNLKIFCGLSIFAIIAVANIAHAATTARPTTATAAATNRTQNRTPSTATHMPTSASTVTETATTVTTVSESESTPVTTTAPDPILEPVIIVNNKTSQFNNVLSEMGASATDSSNAALAETIRRQRALLDAAGDTGATATGGTNITTANACDAALRKCMSEKCGADFTKCASDSTTVWGNKMDACRRNTKCTGHEYTLLAPEILADRDAAIELSYYNSVVNCGNRYNNCVFGICGKSLENCLSKSAGDSAIAKCKSIADECREQDSGLAARVMGVFGDRRNIAATEAQRDEKRLYELRDLMRTQCTRFGAMFDERTLDCVYTVNFFAGTDNTLMASKKLYSGDTFQCTPDWFGVDITTYMENAQRLTRSQTSASAAAMGAGLGTAASLWTSGAVMRGIDTQNAEKQAKEKCTTVGGEWVSAGFNQGSKCDMRKPKADCEGNGGTWDDKTGCSGGNNNSTNNSGNNPNHTGKKPYDTLTNILNKNQDLSNTIATAANCIQYNNNQTECEKADGCIWGAPNKERPDSKGCIAKTDSSTGGGNSNPVLESDFKREDARGTEPTDDQLEKDPSGRTCRKYYTDEWCDEYYKLYNEERKQKKEVTKQQRKQRREEILNKLSTGISNVTTKIGDTFKKNNSSENCETFCDKQAQGISRTQPNKQISTINNQTCYDQCDEAFTKKCQSIFGSYASKFTKQCDTTYDPKACVYKCEYIKSDKPHPAS